MSDLSGVALSHIGICVSDLERSTRFYCDGLGFTAAERHTIGNEFADMLEVPKDVALTAQVIRRDDLTLELLGYEKPSAFGEPSRSRNQLGVTHFVFMVPDMDSAARRLVDLGGSVLEQTRVKQEGVHILVLADPDGVRIELLQLG